jgi:hypothetical protein
MFDEMESTYGVFTSGLREFKIPIINVIKELLATSQFIVSGTEMISLTWTLVNKLPGKMVLQLVN